MQSRSEREWRGRLEDLCARIRRGTRRALDAASENGDFGPLARAVRQGAGDVTYAIDELVEHALLEWLDETARVTPLSLLTEDSGWMHRGPGPNGVRELAGFDHGGPRIALDPIDGTRNLMADLRSAWSVVSFAGPGPDEPRLEELTLGILSELPDSRAARYRVMWAEAAGGAQLETRELESDRLVRARPLRADESARVDHGYFPFFRYAPDQRPALARIEADFFERLREHEGADLRHVFDDQYISNAGQLVQLCNGVYRLIVDARGFLARRAGVATITSKPYDVAGAIFVARAAGCVLVAPNDAPLDFPLDVTTPVDFIGFANRASHARMAPHLWRAFETR
jgi:fructose-1,6-bisphosphatase/inositol monophosphatase family enzyme